MRSWLVFALVALLIAVVALAGWLLGRSSSPPAMAVSQTVQAGDMRVTLGIDQAALGTRVLDILVQDAAGKPANVDAVRLQFAMREMNMGEAVADAQPLGTGHFQARGAFFTMAGSWAIEAILLRDGYDPLRVPFALAIAAPGEASGPLNPLKPDAQTILAGQKLYLANCVVCHGVRGRGDGPSGAGLSPRPADFTQHMAPGLHTDGQVYLWIKNGFPNSAMPAWDKRLTEEQIWQLVTYLRTFGQRAPAQAARPSAVTPATTQPSPTLAAAVPAAKETLPPLVFARQGNIWRSDGRSAEPTQLTHISSESYAEYPTLSPDGGRVAFVVVTQPAVTATLPLPTSALYLMSLDGSDLRVAWKPAQGLLSLPAWAPDGQSLYIATNGVQVAAGANANARSLAVVRYDLATGQARPIVQDALDPTISRDGKQMAFLRLSSDGYTMKLVVAGLDGTGAREILDGADFQGFYAPRFSPDGKRIVVAAIGGPETDSQGYPTKPSGQSPLQRLVGLLAPPSAEAHGLPWDMWVVNVDGSGVRRLTTIYEDLPMAAFSPDGQEIALMGYGGIYRMTAEGGHIRRIDPLGDHGGLDWVRAP